MKIIHSEGHSYTETDNISPRKLRRGLRRDRDKLLTPAEYRNQLKISPARLGSYLTEDYRLALRQVTSALDKVIRKPRNLGSCHLQTYVDRTHLAMALWTRLERNFGPSVQKLENGEDAFLEFKTTWLWKVHPYAENACNWDSPSADANAGVIRKLERDDVSRDSSKGRWHEALWREHEDGTPDYERTAGAIWSHLFEQEITIKGTPRQRHPHSDVRSGGLIAARGDAIAHSAHHPLIPDDVKPEAPHRVREERRKAVRAALKASNIHAIYFAEDIAAQIAETVTERVELHTDRRKPPVNPATFGRLLYEHFGKVGQRGATDDDTKKALWALHNRVRDFYRTLAKSTRFRLAIRGETMDSKKLRQLLPANKAALLKVLNAKTQNADISALIRLGKLVAHATDMPATVDVPQVEFERRLHFYATSEGQNEIKRNETFTRVWRTSVALSLRSLQVLAPATLRPDEDHDPAGPTYAQNAVARLNAADLTNKLELIFGNKQIGTASPGNRADAIRIPAPEGNWRRQTELDKELVWALLRLTGEIRNATNHFNLKRRLLDLLKGGVLNWENEANPGQRKPNFAYEGARNSFGHLLDFDLKLRREVVLDELRRLEVHEYIPGPNIDTLFTELRRAPDMIGLTMPKFMSVLKRAHNTARADNVEVPEWLEPFAFRDLSNQSKATEGPNHFIIGVLRQLYGSGFAAWLAEKQDDTAFLQKALNQVIRYKRQRFDGYQDEERNRGRGRRYAMPDIFAETLPINETTTLDSLISELHARAMSEEALRHTYRPSRDRQSDRTRRVGEFKLDLFAYLFGTYLREDRIRRLMEVTEKLPENNPDRVAPAKLLEDSGQDQQFEVKAWHSVFYVWLYLVPADDVALLRHQFRKTRALEGKAADATSDETLIEIDHLMGLYLSVSSAGFSGTEHAAILNRTVAKKGQFQTDKLADLLLKDMEMHEAALPGTNRGLRQLLQMGTHEPLSRIFEKHPVSRKEVEALRKQVYSPAKIEIEQLFTDRNAIAKQIQELSKKRNPDVAELGRLCADYQTKATAAAIYNFEITGARLRDHSRLHQLMMRIVARLLDFTLMWERDKQYAYLGMLYRRLQEGIVADRPKHDGAPSGELPIAVDVTWYDDSRTKLGFVLPADLRNRLAKVYPAWVASRKSALREPDLLQPDVDGGFLPIWHARFGYILEGDKAEIDLLDGADRVLFERHFVRLDEENPLDQEAREQRKADGNPVHEPQQNGRRPSFYTGRKKIRDDFAHFNMLNGIPHKDGVRHKNFNYLVNSVRSLLAYDRKLKNAVSKSIADILLDEGLIIQWTLREDRLKDPVILPALIPHLDYIRRKDFSPKFGLPKVSVRFTSMVKALFDFGSGGYREEILIKGKSESTGELRYPAQVRERDTVETMGLDVPDEIKNLRYPKLGLDNM